MKVIEAQAPRQKRKVGQVLEGARKIFLRDGFAVASVDDIAREAGVSKATLYSYFPDKHEIFLAVLRAEYARREAEDFAALPLNRKPEAVLMMAALWMVDFVLSDFGLRLYRICMAEVDRIPGLGREFYENGPARVRSRLIDYLQVAVERGELRIDDIPLAASQFLHLCKVDLRDEMLYGMRRSTKKAERQRVAEGAVKMFLACYGAPLPQASE